jgi:hypothetical protein
MVMGQDGLNAMRKQTKSNSQTILALAKDAVNDVSLTWTARIIAMAMIDDIEKVKNAFANLEDVTRGVGAAIEEQLTEEDLFDFDPVPTGHPFQKFCQWNVIDDAYDDPEHAFKVSVAHAAAMFGSVNVLKYLDALHGPHWIAYFDQKGTTMLSSLVQHACYHPEDEEVLNSISVLLSNQSTRGPDQNELYLRHCGSTGNHSHLAAARGHKKLVMLLLTRMNPMRRCDKMKFGDEREEGVKKYYLPVHWASIRGHSDVVAVLQSHYPHPRELIANEVKSGCQMGTSKHQRATKNGMRSGCIKWYV